MIASSVRRSTGWRPDSRGRWAALETLYASSVEEHLAELAHHFERSANLDKAIDYLSRAAQRAGQRSASSEAIEQLTSAFRILKTLPETPQRNQQELILQTMLGPVLIATKGNAADEVAAAYKRAVELGRKVGDNTRLFPVLFGMRSYHLVRAELHQARELGEQLLGLSETIGDAGLSLEVNLAQGNTLFLFGELIPALESFERALALYNPQKHHVHAFLYGLDPGVFCLGRIAWIYARLGHCGQASAKMAEAFALARQQAHAYSSAVAGLGACMIHDLRREWPALQHQAEATIALCHERGFAGLLGQAKTHFGYVLARQGRTEEGIALMREGLAAYRATGAALFCPHFLSKLAQACGIAARSEEGLTLLTEAIALVEKTEEHLDEAELYRVQGMLLTQSDFRSLPSRVQSQAEAAYRKSIEIARRQEAKSLELPSTTSLARLLASQGHRDEARTMLVDIYGWFTEGFDTTDMKDAKALLDRLDAEF